MRRFLMMLIMVLLPLQLSWAAAAAYCQHESNPAITHFGHHVHKHLVKGESSKSDPSVSKLGTDDDCFVCHLSGVGIAFSPSVIVPAQAIPVDATAPPRSSLALLPLERPERPKWARAVFMTGTSRAFSLEV